MPSTRAKRPLSTWTALASSLGLAVLLELGWSWAPMAAAAAESRQTLYVFLHTDVKSTVLERTLQTRLPELSVTVFGRFRDFEEALSVRPPDAVLALEPLLASRRLPAALRGVSDGREVEPLVLISVGSPLTGGLADRTIGVVDLLGRAHTQAFVAALLKAPDIRLKLVTKLEDLLSLLQFSAADAILVPARMVKPFTERSRLPLQVRALPDAAVGRAAVAVLTPSARDAVVRGIQRLDTATNLLMGIDSWRQR